MGKYIAVGQIVLCFVAAMGYAFQHEWRRAIYWAAAGVIGVTVTT